MSVINLPVTQKSWYPSNHLYTSLCVRSLMPPVKALRKNIESALRMALWAWYSRILPLVICLMMTSERVGSLNSLEVVNAFKYHEAMITVVKDSLSCCSDSGSAHVDFWVRVEVVADF